MPLFNKLFKALVSYDSRGTERFSAHALYSFPTQEVPFQEMCADEGLVSLFQQGIYMGEVQVLIGGKKKRFKENVSMKPDSHSSGDFGWLSFSSVICEIGVHTACPVYLLSMKGLREL